MDCGLSKDKDGNDAPDCEKKPAKGQALRPGRSSTTTPSPSRPPRRSRTSRFASATSAFAPLPDSLHRQRQGLRQDADRRGTLQDGVLRPATGAVSSEPRLRGLLRRARSTRSPSRSTRTRTPPTRDVQAGQTDLQVPLPVSALQGEAYKNDSARPLRGEGHRQHLHDQLPLPKADKSYENPKLRKAISMAIDRPSIIKAILANTVSPPPAGSRPLSTATRPTPVARRAPDADAKARFRRGRRLQWGR